MTTVNSWGSDLPVATAGGGLGLSSYATGDIVYASASNVWSKLAAGTNGHVLTQASGVPSWAAEAGGSAGWTWLNTQTAATSASVNFDSTYVTATYDVYVVMWYNMKPDGDDDIIMRFSPDNGSTIRSSGYDSDAYECGSSSNINHTDGLDLSKDPIGGATDEGHAISMVFIANASDSGIKTTGSAWTGHFDRFGLWQQSFVFGKYDTDETHNYIRFQSVSGNIELGTALLFGIGAP